MSGEAPMSEPIGTDAADPGDDVEAVLDVVVDAQATVGTDDGAEKTAEPPTDRPFVEPTPYVPLEYVGVVMALPATNPTLVLREIAGLHRELHIPIALADGVAIAHAAQGIITPRPLTHELFSDVLAAFGLTLETVRITQVVGTSFSAELVLTGSGGMKVLDCRVSDGVCLALRQNLPVPVTADSLVLFHASAPSSTS